LVNYPLAAVSDPDFKSRVKTMLLAKPMKVSRFEEEV